MLAHRDLPYSYYNRRRNLHFTPPDIALQPVEDEKEKPHENYEPAPMPALTERGGESHCPFIFRVMNTDIYLDDLLLLGLIFILLQDWHGDYILIFALIFLFLIGKE